MTLPLYPELGEQGLPSRVEEMKRKKQRRIRRLKKKVVEAVLAMVRHEGTAVAVWDCGRELEEELR